VEDGTLAEGGDGRGEGGAVGVFVGVEEDVGPVVFVVTILAKRDESVLSRRGHSNRPQYHRWETETYSLAQR
jgi:hypothetical protein